MNLDQLAVEVGSFTKSIDHPAVIGVSGYGGSGKSTAARGLSERLPGAARIRGDDFLDPSRSHRRSADWDGVERSRLATEVFLPHREGRASSFRRYDWSLRALGAAEPIPECRILIVDVIGLFHPEIMELIDLKLWCDVDLATAQRRGMRRDSQLGRDHVQLWNEVWVPNEQDFDAGFSPRKRAEILIPND